MLRRVLPIALLSTIAPLVPAGGVSTAKPPVLPEVKQHLVDGWACLNDNPGMAKGHALAVLVSSDLAVEVQLDKVPEERRSACRAAIDGALESWEKSLGGGVHLHRLEEGGHSGIVVRFQPDVRQRGEAVAGYVNWKRTAAEGEGSVTGDIQIRTVNLNGTAMSGKAMRNIVVHEVGHLLGLDDTDRMGEAMSPLDPNHPVSGPSDAESNTVRSLRDEATKILNDAR
jgi:hypothetical protein